MERTPELAAILVRGEILNFKAHISGHMYFSLCDEKASVRAVMFRSRAQHLQFEPKNGQLVLAAGYVSLYERDGSFQLYCEHLEPAGVGSGALALEQLRVKLAAEGVFDPARKRALPAWPRRLGVVTALGGAALQDILTVARRRNPQIDILVAGAQVQGSDAAHSLIQALRGLYASKVDVVIVGRGGGASEDLSAFNDEGVVRTLAAAPVPTVSAVGHEVDTTLCDFAADVRAATPSQAAELAVPEHAAMQQLWRERVVRLSLALARRHKESKARLQALTSRPVWVRPAALLTPLREQLRTNQRALERAATELLQHHEQKWQRLATRLHDLGPQTVLKRGYAFVEDARGHVIEGAAQITVGQDLHIHWSDGVACSRVQKVRVGQQREGDEDVEF